MATDAEQSSCDSPAAMSAEGHSMLVHRSPRVARERTGAWVGAALDRGFRVLCKYTGLAWPVAELIGSAGRDPGSVTPVDAADVFADTGGRPAALRAWHEEHLGRARAEGYAGLALACDGSALRVIAPEPAARMAHERDLTELAAAAAVAVLCRYDLAVETDDDLDGLLRVHAPAVEDVVFAAYRHRDRLTLTGEIESSNAARFAAVLSAAIQAGVRTVDVAGLRLLSAAGLRALDAATAPLGRSAEQVRFLDAGPLVQRVLHVSGLLASGVIVLDN
ncbi:MEDS domain-containing protein [Amycolatopsis sp., V23-08]|uniref:MEDS domain-containing protein n=1 Tax=Amycolatopsis heterodermiae TaxID=3110235 RepID=A0ABU5R920_9PSEU|nr:MEDS domain-containing protein [Amycolatopsis sp., V23-08]MEA5362628.1 MEDS domain-containing protein [Amycolatopsis sp., V23-08]